MKTTILAALLAVSAAVALTNPASAANANDFATRFFAEQQSGG